MLCFLKLGGSLITDKNQESTFLRSRMAELSGAIHTALSARSDLRLLMGHGSGSFGHFAARKHGTVGGVSTPAQWQGFAEVARVARSLNELVASELSGAGIHVWPIQPSASAECKNGELQTMATWAIQRGLEQGLVPLVHGDVALDHVQGGTIISTESVFFYLAPIFRPQRIFLFGEVDGVLDGDGRVIPLITPDMLPSLGGVLGGSHGVDVTGGMSTKVRDMIRLAQAVPEMSIHILSGLDASVVEQAMLDPDRAPGTVIKAL